MTRHDTPRQPLSSHNLQRVRHVRIDGQSNEKCAAHAAFGLKTQRSAVFPAEDGPVDVTYLNG